MLKAILQVNGKPVEINLNQVQRIRNFLTTEVGVESVLPVTTLNLEVFNDPGPSPGRAAYEALDAEVHQAKPWRKLTDAERGTWETIAAAAREFAG